MLKSGMIFSVLITLFILLIFILGKNALFLQLKKENLANQNRMETTEQTSALLQNAETNQQKHPSKYTSDDFQAGMNVLIYGQPNILEASQVFEHLQSLGINSVAINFPFYQADWQANEVTTNPLHTPTVTELEEIIKKAHDADLSVMLRPIMDEQVFLPSHMWRGQIEPEDPLMWFDSYEVLLRTYATLAQSTGVKALNIGTELNSLQNQYEDRWATLIDNIRQVYNGELLYSFNWDTVHEIPSIEFVKLLDFVGIDAYFPLDVPDGATTEMLKEEWQRQLAQIEDALPQQNIIVTEAGIIPIAGAYRTPYAWSLPDGKFDAQAQISYYEATYNVWKPRIQGIYWWTVTLGQDPAEISFSPLYSPTENVIKKHFLKEFPND